MVGPFFSLSFTVAYLMSLKLCPRITHHLRYVSKMLNKSGEKAHNFLKCYFCAGCLLLVYVYTYIYELNSLRDIGLQDIVGASIASQFFFK